MTTILKPNHDFKNQSSEFWANVRTISQEVGYTERGGTKNILVPSLQSVRKAFGALSLNTRHLVENGDRLTDFGRRLFGYFEYRARILNTQVRPALMQKAEAQGLFEEHRRRLNPRCYLPMNKQKKEKRGFAFLTGLVNMLIEENIGDAPCNYDPRTLTTITHDGAPLRTLSRRVDGAFPSTVNPVAIWEIKEYYNTTTFGSRVADGVYETLLDGHELHELEAAAGRKVQHVLIVDDYRTWWEDGRAYLCRIIDMLHMGYVDEVIFGREVIQRMPTLAREWVAELDRLQGRAH